MLLPLVTVTALKSFPALFNVMSLADPAASVVAPGTFNAPLCVSAPLVVTLRLPEMVELPDSSHYYLPA